jgi:hypothetical protein
MAYSPSQLITRMDVPQDVLDAVAAAPPLPVCEAVGGGSPAPMTLTEEPIVENSELAQRAENDINPPKKLKKQDIKKLFHAYFTVRRDKVKACGHKFDMAHDPRTNCENCWYSYFANNGPMTQTADECFQKEGRETLERIRGKRFVKFFLRFMSTIARWKAEAEAAQKLKEQETHECEGEQSENADRSIGAIPERAGIPSGLRNNPADNDTYVEAEVCNSEGCGDSAQ